MRRALTFVRSVRFFAMLLVGLSMLIRIFASVVSIVSSFVRIACVLFIRLRRRRINAIFVVRLICRSVSCSRALKFVRLRR